MGQDRKKEKNKGGAAGGDALKEKPFDTMAGTSGVIVMDETVCVVRIAARIARFQGITARSRAMPQKPVAPAMNRPAPTKAGSFTRTAPTTPATSWA